MKEHPDAVENYEGGLSFTVDPRTELYLRAASCLVGEQKFYESANFADHELISAIHNVLRIDPEFVLQLAVYLREQMHLRSVPLVLCAEYANVAPGSVMGARKYISRCIARADELTEIIAYQFSRNEVSPRKAKLPMAIKAGVAAAYPKFSGYQLAKYNRDGGVTLKDALFMTHPIPDNELQQNSWDALVDGTLASPETWEVMRSTGRMTWHDVVNDVFHKDGKIMSYMAQLRNIRNILNSDDVTDSDVRLMCDMISNENAVHMSKQLPFRFLSAYKVLQEIDHH
ncbi:MAG: TROVE domain-containing protein, partial [Deltaproteobacteria bacterium]|nr:TROVE domain-containing protein [Deltaproteobacteria bacterium]